MAPSAPFPLLPLGEVTEFINGDRGHNYPSPTEFVAEGIPFISAADLVGGRVALSGAHRITEQAFERLGSGKIQAGDVLFCLRGSLGKTARVTGPFRGAIASSLVIVRPSARIDTKYLYYVLAGPLGQALARELDNGSVQPNISARSLMDARVPFPGTAEQRAIAHFLGTLDDKVELNRQMNETLEAMTRAIFKSWFVDFDPVRAKVEGREPEGMDAETAALFPDTLRAGPLGKTPSGWTITSLSALASFVLGGDWGSDEAEGAEDSRAFCIRGADIPDLQAGGVGRMPVRFLNPSSLGKRRLLSGDIVIEISGGSPTQSTGRPVLVSERLLRRLEFPLVCSNFCRLVRPATEHLSHYVYLWLRWLYSNDELLQYENGTTGIKNLAFSLFSEKHALVQPPKSVLVAFHGHVGPLFELRARLGEQAATLAALRDALLPKLLSGEVRVSLPQC